MYQKMFSNMITFFSIRDTIKNLKLSLTDYFVELKSLVISFKSQAEAKKQYIKSLVDYRNTTNDNKPNIQQRYGTHLSQ